MKNIMLVLLAAMFCFGGCAEEKVVERSANNAEKIKKEETTVFMEFGDFAEIVEAGEDISVWKTLCETPFPSFDETKEDINPDKPMIALTFDDGPNAHTERLLDIFAEKGGKGTFFLVGNTIEKRESVVRRMAEDGHEIGNHGWTHSQLTDMEEKAIVAEIMRTRAKVYEVTGLDSHLVRPPYGAYNDMMKIVGNKVGVCYVNWSVDSIDWKSKDRKAVVDEILNHVSDGAIILCHDLHKTTVDAMEDIIPKLINDGYQLVTVSELLAYSEKTITPGDIYYRQ